MPSGWLISSALRSLAAIVATVVFSIGGVLASDSTSIAPKKSAPVQHDRKSRELSPSALGMETSKSKFNIEDDKPDMKRPDEIQFGENTLHFDANRKNSLPPGLEDNEHAVINKAPTEPALKPNYFGLRLTTPIR